MEQLKKSHARVVFDMKAERGGISTSVKLIAHKDCDLSEEDILMSLLEGLTQLGQKFGLNCGMSVSDLDDHETVQ